MKRKVEIIVCSIFISIFISCKEDKKNITKEDGFKIIELNDEVEIVDSSYEATLDDYTYEQLYDSVIYMLYEDISSALKKGYKNKALSVLEYLINKDYVPAYSLLGCELTKGDSFKKDLKKGNEYLDYAVNKNDLEAIICKSTLLFNENNIDKSIELLELGCMLKDKQACLELGSIFLYGEMMLSDVAIDKNEFMKKYYNPYKGFNYLVKSSSYGMSEAKLLLGDIYLTGLDSIVEKDLEKGKKLLKECLMDNEFTETYSVEQRLNEVFGKNNW